MTDVHMSDLRIDDNSSRANNGQSARTETSPERKEYLRRYYRENRERAREYQRQYSLKHKRKARAEDLIFGKGRREKIRSIFHQGDIMQSPTEKSIKMLDQILKGERFFTM